MVAVVGVGAGSHALAAAHPEESDERRHEPQHRRQEGEGDVGLELAALVAARGDVVPVEDGAAGRTDELHTSKRRV